jgi:hypothetical protein
MFYNLSVKVYTKSGIRQIEKNQKKYLNQRKMADAIAILQNGRDVSWVDIPDG